MNEYEKKLLNDKNELSTMNNLLRKYQFSEEFLIKTRLYYDSWKCLKTQTNLSADFCFKYLYDRPDLDSADDWSDYNDVYRYLKQRNLSDEEISKAFMKREDN